MPTQKATKDELWIAASEAVQKISSNLDCDLDAAAEILLSFSKGRNVSVRCWIYFHDLREVFLKPDIAVLSDPYYFTRDEWSDMVKLATASDFAWSRSELTVTESTMDHENRIEFVQSTTTAGRIEFRRADLDALLLPRKAGSGGKPYGAFWPKLAEEVAVYVHDNGPPAQAGQSQAATIREILDRFTENDDRPDGKVTRPPGASTVQALLVALNKRLAR